MRKPDLSAWIGLSYVLLAGSWVVLTQILSAKNDSSAFQIGSVLLLVFVTGVLFYIFNRRTQQGKTPIDSAHQEPDALFASLLDVTTDGIIHVSPDQRITFINRGAEILFGFRANEILTQPLNRLIPLDATETYAQLFQELRVESHSPTLRRTATGYHKNGTQFPVEVLFTRISVEGFISFIVIVRDITEQVQAEQEARLSAIHLRTVAENMPVMLFAMDAEGGILVWNQECERVTGYPAHEIVGNPDALSILYPDKNYLLDLLVKWGEKNDNFRDWEWDITCHDGSVRTIAWSNISNQFPIPGWATWAVGVDVTERKQAEQSLEKERNFATTVLDTVGSLVVVLDTDARIVRFNKTCQRLTGYRFEEVQGKYLWDLFIIPEEKDAVMGIFHDLRDKAYPNQYENFWLTKDGERRLIAWSNTTIGDSAQKATHIIATGMDITERQESESRIRYQASLLQNVSDAIISTQMDFTIRTWNKAAEQIYGWQAEEVIGKRLPEVIKAQYGEPVTPDGVPARFLDAGEWEGEVIHTRKDGTPVHILSALSLLRDEKGSSTGTVGVYRNITELKQMQEQLFQVELQQMELEKEREFVNLKEQFMSMMSHEFRTPLTVILSGADLLKNYYNRLGPEKRLKHLLKIIAQAEYMNALLEDALLFSKGSVGKLEFNPAPVDVETFCREIFEQTRLMDDGKHTFVLEHEVVGERLMDQKLLQHILSNLLSNAVKYSPLHSEVKCQLQQQEDDYLVFQVSDQGIGIPLRDQERMFEPFHRARNTGDVSGTGLGLAIVKSCVDTHGGTIMCESREGNGTTFTVRLPAKPV
jgi:PAS domain S-box-containing protein